jgi:DnaJ-class molecular chaperone
MAKRDYYQILGLRRGADLKAIKSAYRKLARKYHPDVNKEPSAAKRFHEATEAYDVLSDPAKRRLYDAYGHAGLENPAGPRQQEKPPEGSKLNIEEILGGAGAFAGMSLREILSRLKGKKDAGQANAEKAQASSRDKQRGQDVDYHLTLEFEEAARGATRGISIRRQESDGQSETESLEVRIPPGVDEGARIRVKGKGRPGKGGPGDLFIVIHVSPHKWFRREGNDVYVDLPVGIVDATLGTEAEVPTLEGMVSMKVPPGSASGRKLRLRGRGIPSRNGGAKGDQFVVLQIQPPRKVSEQGAALLRQFARDESEAAPRRAPWQ